MEREIYQNLLKQYRNGDVTYVQLEDRANVIFMGADYSNFELKNLYKSLNLIKPDLVMLQVRPDLVLDKFKDFD